MNEEELRMWVRGQLRLGHSPEELRQKLAESGRDAQTITALLGERQAGSLDFPFSKDPPEEIKKPDNAKEGHREALFVIEKAGVSSFVFLLLFTMVWFTSFYFDRTYLGIPLGVGLFFLRAFYLGSVLRTKKKAVLGGVLYSTVSVAGVFAIVVFFFYSLGFDYVRSYLYRNTSFLTDFIFEFGSIFALSVVAGIVLSLFGNMVSKRLRLPGFGALKPVVLFFAVWLAIVLAYSYTGSEAGVDFEPGKYCAEYMANNPSKRNFVSIICYQALDTNKGIKNDELKILYGPEIFYSGGIPPRNKFSRVKYELSAVYYIEAYVPWYPRYSGFEHSYYLLDLLFSKFGVDKYDYFSGYYTYSDSFNKAVGEKKYKDALVVCLDAASAFYDGTKRAVDDIYSRAPEAEYELGPKKSVDSVLAEQKRGSLILRDKLEKLEMHYEGYTPDPREKWGSYSYRKPSLVSVIQKVGGLKDEETYDMIDRLCNPFIGAISFDIGVNRAQKTGTNIKLELENLVPDRRARISSLLVNGLDYRNTACEVEITPNGKLSCEFELQNSSLVLLDKYGKELFIIVRANMSAVPVMLNESNNFSYSRP